MNMVEKESFEIIFIVFNCMLYIVVSITMIFCVSS